MASAFNRGTKANPRWYAKYRDASGTWRMVATNQTDRRSAVRVAQELEAKAERERLGLERPERPDPLCGELLERWSLGLTNRAALIDRARVRLHLIPRFRDVPLSKLDLRLVLTWLEEMRKAGTLALGSQRHNLNLLSRFFGWCIEEELVDANPVRSVPTRRKPQAAQKRDVPWIQDDALVVQLMAAMPEPFGLMFFLGNRSGLRLGEICGLRMSDLAYLAEGAVRVRYSYGGPLKEDKRGEGKVKWSPAPSDAAAVLGPWLARRRAVGADDESLVFPRPDGRMWHKEDVHARWARARTGAGLTLTWYQATRHSFVSRNLAAGVSLDEVSAAVGHSSPLVTRRHYDHFIRKTFSATMRAGLAA